jgi:FkbM family methyltransferase
LAFFDLGWKRKTALDALELKTADGVTLAVPASLQSVTTYVLLEQEAWFEKEMIFLRRWLQPGMTAIDIGANLGVYSLTMARLVGRNGRVFAYEPGSEARALLERSRELNGFENLHISPFALSDGEREGRLSFGDSTEFNILGDTGPGEAVRITSLDIEAAARGWPAPDFIKIDAEGEEERILAGGREFLTRHSPLIMFEVEARHNVTDRLRTLFLAIGYRLFRQLADAPILVPDDPAQPVDDYELNLFAAKADRVSVLSQQGFLVDSIPAWAPSEPDRQLADAFWRGQKFAPPIQRTGSGAFADAGYRDSLAAYAIWRTVDRPVATRCAALAVALHGLRLASERIPSPGRLSTLARVAWEWGARAESVAVLRRLFALLQSGQIQLNEPLWPASARFDRTAPGGDIAAWFVGAAAEQFEKTWAFSSAFVGASPALEWLRTQPFAAIEMERRHVLLSARAGQRLKVPKRLQTAAPDHLNADIWRAGKVPGTIV